MDARVVEALTEVFAGFPSADTDCSPEVCVYCDAKAGEHSGLWEDYPSLPEPEPGYCVLVPEGFVPHADDCPWSIAQNWVRSLAPVPA